MLKLKITILLLTILLVDIKIASAVIVKKHESFISNEKICDAIWFVEGQEKANQYYGINPKYVKCDTKEACRNVCIRTVAKWRRVYNLREHPYYRDFTTFLSYKYCPPNHTIWLKNLKFWLRKLK